MDEIISLTAMILVVMLGVGVLAACWRAWRRKKEKEREEEGERCALCQSTDKLVA